MDEFDLIRKYFYRKDHALPASVRVGIGDDAAVCVAPAECELTTTTDLFIAGTHFLESAAADHIGHKVLAVNLSDLAAMGAEPLWFTMTLSLPAVDEPWLQDFAAGLFALADHAGIALIGGDTVRGPLGIGIQATGAVPVGKALLRSGAKAGDVVYVTGSLGDAALGLKVARDGVHFSEIADTWFISRLEQPTPRLEIGKKLQGVASAAIDISDGLVADLGHICRQSDVGARIEIEALPLSGPYRDVLATVGYELALTGGDDYELCFTAPADKADVIAKIASECACPITRIGVIEVSKGVAVIDHTGAHVDLTESGHLHFHG